MAVKKILMLVGDYVFVNMKYRLIRQLASPGLYNRHNT